MTGETLDTLPEIVSALQKADAMLQDEDDQVPFGRSPVSRDHRPGMHWFYPVAISFDGFDANDELPSQTPARFHQHSARIAS